MKPTTEELIRGYEEMKSVGCSCYDDEGICRRCYALDRLLGRLDVLEEYEDDIVIDKSNPPRNIKDEINKIKEVLS